MMINRIYYVFGFFLLASKVMAQQQDTLRQSIITNVSHDLLKYYLNAESAREMAYVLKKNFELGKYNDALNIDEFNYEITEDLRSVSNDKHLTITSSKAAFFDIELYQKELANLTEKQRRLKFREDEKKYQEQRKYILEDNYSYGDVKILPGNVGYLEIRLFNDGTSQKKDKGTKIADVFNFLNNTASLIIDLRENAGGSVEQVAKFVSYFSDSINRYLFTTQTFVRYDSAGIQKEMVVPMKRYTYPNDNGYRVKYKKLFILVSTRTFSAAESVTYLIKKLCPDTKVIGEITMGGGHIYGSLEGGKYYSAIIPTGKFIDEEKGNYSFDGTGIEPDIKVRSDSAYEIAYHYAVKNTNISKQEIKYLVRKRILNNEVDLSNYFPEYIGNYMKIKILKNGNDLFINYDGHTNEKMIAKSKDVFESESIINIQFLRNNSNNVVGVRVQPEQQFFETFFKHR